MYSCVDVFPEVVSRDLRDLRQNIDHSCNLSPEQQALMSLERNNKIIIKSPDKAGNIVVLNSSVYREMCLAILRDTNCYEILPESATRQYRNKLKSILDEALQNRVISIQEHGFLLPENPVVATFYGLHKIHKGLCPLNGWPIVSGVNNLTQNAGLYINKVLRDFVTALPFYTRETADLLRKLEGIRSY